MGIRNLTVKDARVAAQLVRIIEDAVSEEFKGDKALNPLKGNQTFRARVRDCCVLLTLQGAEEDAQ